MLAVECTRNSNIVRGVEFRVDFAVSKHVYLAVKS